MARLGDLLKISTDSYKRLEVVYCYACRHIVVKNDIGNYAIAYSYKVLKIGDVLLYTKESIEGNTVSCKYLGKDYTVILKMRSICSDKKSAINKIKKEQKRTGMSSEQKAKILGFPCRHSQIQKEELKGPRMRVISIPMGGQNKKY